MPDIIWKAVFKNYLNKKIQTLSGIPKLIEDIIRQVTIFEITPGAVYCRFTEGQHLALSTLSLDSVNFALVTPSQWLLRGTSEAMTISYDNPIREIKFNTKDTAVCVKARKVYGEAEV